MLTLVFVAAGAGSRTPSGWRTWQGQLLSVSAALWATKGMLSGSRTAFSANEGAGKRWRSCRLRTPWGGGGGEVVSWGETGTYACNIWANEIQAGSYALTDSAYGRLGLPFEQAVTILATVVSTSRDWSVADAGLKAFGMDHGKPEIDGTTVLSCSDEHAVFAPPRQVGQRVRIVPAHIDPTMAYHERAYVVSGETVIDVWPIDLRGW